MKVLLGDFIKGIWKENPVFVILLGMCPTLAVTTKAVFGLSMGLAVIFVLTSLQCNPSIPQYLHVIVLLR